MGFTLWPTHCFNTCGLLCFYFSTGCYLFNDFMCARCNLFHNSAVRNGYVRILLLFLPQRYGLRRVPAVFVGMIFFQWASSWSFEEIVKENEVVVSCSS